MRNAEMQARVSHGDAAESVVCRPGRMVRVLRALGWLLWAAVLQGMVAPSAYDISMSTTPRYTAIACGMLVTAFVFAGTGRSVKRLCCSKTACASVVTVGCLATVAGIALRHPVWLGVVGNVAASLVPYISLTEMLEAILFAMAAACCTVIGIVLATCELGQEADAPLQESGRATQRRDAGVLLAFTLAGLFRAPAMLWCLPHDQVDIVLAGDAYRAVTLGESEGVPLAALCLSLFIASAASVVCALRARSHAGAASREAVASWAVRVAAAYGTGGVIWYLLMQVVSLQASITDAASFLCFAAELLVFIIAMALARVGSVSDGRSAETPDSACTVPVTPACAVNAVAPADMPVQSACGLTDRERACLHLALEGRTSASIADELGIGASTARSYLQRAYRKLGVSSLGEARECMAAQSPVPEIAVKAVPNRVVAERIGWAGRAFAGAFSLLATLLLLPDASRGSWGAGFASVYALAVAALIAAVWNLAPNGGESGAILPPAVSRAVHAFPLSAVFMVVLGIARASFLVVGYRALPWPFKEWYGVERAVELLLLCALLSSLIALARRVHVVSPWEGAALRPCLPSVVLGVSLGAMIVALVPDSLAVYLLAAVLAAACAAFAVHVICGSTKAASACDDETQAPLELDNTVFPMLVPTVLLAACALEAIWRDRAQFSFAPAFVPWLLALAALLLKLLSPRAGFRFAACTLAFGVPVTACASACGYGPMVLFAFDAALAACLMLCVRCRVHITGQLRARCLALFAVGLVMSVKAMNLFGDVSLWAYQSMYSSFASSVAAVVPVSGAGDLRGTLLALGAAFVAVMSIGSILLLAFVARNAAGELSVRRQLSAPSFDGNRLRSYLAGRGLNETQTEVLIATARGKTAPSIAAELHYASGTVSSARDAGYRLLRVHSRTQLVALLRRDAGL